LYVAPLPGYSGRKIKVSDDGGGWPRWSRDGKELFFLANDDRLMLADVRGHGGDLQIGVPRALFDTQRKDVANGWPYDVAPDGRILINTRSDAALAPPVTLLINWSALITRPN
jgi:hypothetical protein